MQNKRGIELALSTVIVVVIVILVLVGITYLLTDGFKKFRGTTSPYLQSTEAMAIKQVCETACNVADKVAFCNEYTFGIDAATKAPKKEKCPAVYKEYGLSDCSINC